MSEDDEAIIEVFPDEEDLSHPTDVPGYLLLQDTKRFNEARAAWALTQLVSTEGVLPSNWREEWKDIVRGLRDGPEALKHPKAKTALGVVKGGAGADAT